MKQKPSESAGILEAPWSFSYEQVRDCLKADDEGLSEVECKLRLQRYGPNRIAEIPADGLWTIWARQFRSLIVVLLAVAAAVSAYSGDWMEAGAIAVVILLNALIGFLTEVKANRSMDALKKLVIVSVRVLRPDGTKVIPSEDLVPGDIVFLEAGDAVAADMRISEANALESDESTLTGESLPIQKQAEPISQDTVLAERSSMLFSGARITAGTGKAIVTATAGKSELGKISELVSRAKHHSTPLEKKLDRLSYRLIWVTLFLTVLVAVAGIVAGHDPFEITQTAIALAVAAIPEGLPVVATIALAHGLWRMAERNALINRLSAVETLGATGVICTDKTGTLTENRMTATSMWPAGESEPQDFSTGCESAMGRRVIETVVLCNNAELSTDKGRHAGDPLDVALLEGPDRAGVDIARLRERWPRVSEVPFDSLVRMMATIHEDGEEGLFVAVKGAPEAVLERCTGFPDGDGDRGLWEERNRRMATEGLRVIAVAGKKVREKDEEPYSGLTLFGLVGLIDPPRRDVPASIGRCVDAGVKLVMVTGDQMATADAVARQIGMRPSGVMTGSELEKLDPDNPEHAELILNTDVIARATPDQKLMLVRLYQDNGHIVAMTGDGVNDAPALKQADIGIAMGLRGTDVAREAAAMVLRDDAFPSIVAAIEQGRTIFSNIRKFVAYLISCNLSEILVVVGATLFAETLPILPLQILFLNLVTDVFPAFALGVTRAHGRVLSNPPRDAREPVLRREDWVWACWQAVIISGVTLAAFEYAMLKLGQTPVEAITISFLTLATSQLFHVLNMVDRDERFFASMVVKNAMVWVSFAICFALLVTACYVPALAKVLGLHPPGSEEWQVVLVFSIVPVAVEVLRRSVSATFRRLRRAT